MSFFLRDWGVPEDVANAVASRYGLSVNSSKPYEMQHAGFAVAVDVLQSLDELGTVDWGGLLDRPDVPAEIWNHPFPFVFGCYHGSAWLPADLSIGAVALLCSMRAGSQKNVRGIVLSHFKSHRRVKGDVDPLSSEGVTAVYGMPLDDDGVIGRDNVNAKYLAISYATASDGKSAELILCDAYRRGAAKLGLPLVPNASGIAAYLNQHCNHGPAYRQVCLRTTNADTDTPAVIREKHELYYAVTFEPQQRTRFLVPYARPIEGELLRQLIDTPHGFKRLGEKVELTVLGTRGTDENCFDPARIAYGPSGDRPNFQFAVIGPPILLDVIPLVEEVLAEAPRRERREYAVSSLDVVPTHLASNLRGVALASLISDSYSELVHSDNGLKPLIMKCCPFADEHGSKRGHADNSLYCYDPDQTPYPVMRCRHQTCAARKTEDFVEAMIAHGDLDRRDVFENAEYRAAYEHRREDHALPNPKPDWRKHINKL